MGLTQILLVGSIFVNSHVFETFQTEDVDSNIEPNEFLLDKSCNSLVVSASHLEGY